MNPSQYPVPNNGETKKIDERDALIELDRESTVLELRWDGQDESELRFEFKGIGLSERVLERPDQEDDSNEIQFAASEESQRRIHRGTISMTEVDGERIPVVRFENQLIHPNLVLRNEFHPKEFDPNWQPEAGIAWLVEEIWDFIRLAHVDKLEIKNAEAWNWLQANTDLKLPLDPRPLRDRCLPDDSNVIRYERLRNAPTYSEPRENNVIFIGSWDPDETEGLESTETASIDFEDERAEAQIIEAVDDDSHPVTDASSGDEESELPISVQESSEVGLDSADKRPEESGDFDELSVEPLSQYQEQVHFQDQVSSDELSGNPVEMNPETPAVPLAESFEIDEESVGIEAEELGKASTDPVSSEKDEPEPGIRFVDSDLPSHRRYR